MAPRVMPEKLAKVQAECEWWLWSRERAKIDEITRLADMLNLSEATVQAIWEEAENDYRES